MLSIAYVMHKTPNVFPVVGGRKLEHVKANIEALGIALSEADVEEIDAAWPFDPGFPMTFLFRGQMTPSGNASDVFNMRLTTHLDVPERRKAVKPRQL